MNREIQWVVSQYPALANHPMLPSRKEEFKNLRAVAERYDIDLSVEAFDAGIAERFGFGAEYEWPRD